MITKIISSNDKDFRIFNWEDCQRIADYELIQKRLQKKYYMTAITDQEMILNVGDEVKIIDKDDHYYGL